MEIRYTFTIFWVFSKQTNVKHQEVYVGMTNLFVYTSYISYA